MKTSVHFPTELSGNDASVGLPLVQVQSPGPSVAQEDHMMMDGMVFTKVSFPATFVDASAQIHQILIPNFAEIFVHKTIVAGNISFTGPSVELSLGTEVAGSRDNILSLFLALSGIDFAQGLNDADYGAVANTDRGFFIAPTTGTGTNVEFRVNGIGTAGPYTGTGLHVLIWWTPWNVNNIFP